MKKFDHWHVIQVAGYPAYKSPTTYWVKAEEAEALEQLNKEMLEVLKDAHNEILAMHIIYEGRDGSENPLLQQIKSIIAKAEEV